MSNRGWVVGFGVGLAAMLPMLGGCLVMSSKTEVVGKDAQRQPVRFENDKALEDFQKSVSDRYAHGGGKIDGSAFAVPFIIASSKETKLSENAYYNEQIKKADVDGDGVISEAEARVYAATGAKKQDSATSQQGSVKQNAS